MKKLSLLTVLFFCFSFSQGFAQFEGRIEIENYEIESGKKVKDDDSFVLYITPNRIFLRGEENYKLKGSLKADGILVRQKEQDFVLLTGKKQAMKITKAGITSFVNMFGSDTGNARGKSNLQIKNTGQKKTLNGYSTEKFTLTDSKHPDWHSEIWMTKDIDINWGILAESWDTNMEVFTDSDFPLNLIFDDGYFPVRWEHYKNNTLSSVAETTVESTPIEPSLVELESDVKIVSLSDYLFQQLRNGQ